MNKTLGIYMRNHSRFLHNYYERYKMCALYACYANVVAGI